MSVHVRGHPIHVMLVAFPIGLFTFSFIFDMVYAAGGDPAWYTAGFYNLLFGVVTTVPTAIFGMFDYTLLRDPRAKTVATRHMLVTIVATAAFAISLFVRSTNGFAVPLYGGTWYLAVGLSAVGIGFLMAGGWLGGELVYRQRVGVGIEPADHMKTHPVRDEAGNVANDFAEFPTQRPKVA